MVKLVIVSAQWCSTCRLVKASLNQKGIEYSVLDCDEKPEDVEGLGVSELPTIIAYNNNDEIGRWVDSNGDFDGWYNKMKGLSNG